MGRGNAGVSRLGAARPRLRRGKEEEVTRASDRQPSPVTAQKSAKSSCKDLNDSGDRYLGKQSKKRPRSGSDAEDAAGPKAFASSSSSHPSNPPPSDAAPAAISLPSSNPCLPASPSASSSGSRSSEKASVSATAAISHTVYEVASCDPDHTGPWNGLWEECGVILRRPDGATLDVKILSDDTVCLSVPARFVRSRIIEGPAPTPHAPDFFARHPLSRVAGGLSKSRSKKHATAGRVSFPYFLRRLSDRNYAMRSCCMSAASTVIPGYGTFSSPTVAMRCVSWRVPRGDTLSELSAQNPQFNDKVVDTFHTDLCDPTTGRSLLTLQNLTNAVRERGSHLECLFINRLEHEDCAAAIRLASRQSSSVRCLTICESVLSSETLAAVATLGSSLRGLILSNNHSAEEVDGEKEGMGYNFPSDAAMALVLASLPRLEFFVFENALPLSSGGRGSGDLKRKQKRRRHDRPFVKTCTRFFGDKCWNALGTRRCCPHLRVLWVDEIHPDWHRRPVSDNIVVHREIFVSHHPSTLSRQLDLFMLNPDRELRSLAV